MASGSSPISDERERKRRDQLVAATAEALRPRISVALRDVRKSYGKYQVIHGVSLDVADGEFIVFVGPSGCGKSTMLRMIAGLETISEGQLLIDGRVMNEETPTSRGIAMVFQSYALYPNMTVYQNMAFGLEQARMPRAKIRELVMDAAHTLKIEPLLQRRPGQLSGGQSQRVAIGRSIVRNPRIFLFDERPGIERTRARSTAV